MKVVDNDIETLATALYVKIDDMLRDWPDLAPARPATGTPLTLSDAEVLTMAAYVRPAGVHVRAAVVAVLNKDLAACSRGG